MYPKVEAFAILSEMVDRRLAFAFSPATPAFSEEDIPGAAASAGVLAATSLIRQLEDLDATAQRSVAKETEHAIESGSALLDEAGRERVLRLCEPVRNHAARLSRPVRELQL